MSLLVYFYMMILAQALTNILTNSLNYAFTQVENTTMDNTSPEA